MVSLMAGNRHLLFNVIVLFLVGAQPGERGFPHSVATVPAAVAQRL